ncbi:MAG: DUF5681 domain-containing protein [Acidobacteriota bacterium]
MTPKKNNNGVINAKQRGKGKAGGVTGKGFLPGKSGNPAGRPPTKGLLIHLRGELGEVTNGLVAEAVIARKLVNLAKRGNLAAIRECFDRTEGKPRQQLDLNDITRELQNHTDEELLHYATTGKWPNEVTDA